MILQKKTGQAIYSADQSSKKCTLQIINEIIDEMKLLYKCQAMNKLLYLYTGHTIPFSITI